MEGGEIRDKDGLAVKAFQICLANDGKDLLPEGVRNFAEADFEDFQDGFARFLEQTILTALLQAPFYRNSLRFP